MKNRVLVVDDQKGIRRLLEELFTKEGYAVSLANDGRDCVEKVKLSVPDIILMDMKMPNMNGLEASREVIRYNASIPIIMMTAYGEMEVVQKALEAGVRKYVTKPFDIIELRNLVEEILAEKSVPEG
ncbi:MAG: response regulator [Syntrophomonadaceae bacterium]|nr:response regulator [Syntrophomonadaceae bacterium]